MPTRSHALARIEDAFVEECLTEDEASDHEIARYMSRRRLEVLLTSLVVEVAEELGVKPTSGPSRAQALAHLAQRGLVVPIARAPKAADTPYWLKLRGGSPSHPNPLELASSTSRHAIVSDITALRFHGANDFQPTNEYVRIPTRSRAGRTPREVREVRAVLERTRSSSSKGQEPVGTPMFTFGEVTYRRRTVTEDLAFGVREVWTDERERVWVFDLERSLLLALVSPRSNGGVRGVLEAWDASAEHLRVRRLEDYIRRLGRASYARRVGAIADFIDDAELARAMEALCEELDEEWNPIPVIAGMEGGRLWPRWEVMVPW